MAWQIDYHPHTSSIQSGEWSYPVALTWGTFVVHALKYSYDTTKAIINFRDISSLIPVAYICNDLTDFEDTEGVPHNFIDALLGNGTVEIDLSALESKTIFIGVRPATTSDIGSVVLVSNFETSGGGGGGDTSTPRYIAVGNNSSQSITVTLENYDRLPSSTFRYYIRASDDSMMELSPDTQNTSYTFEQLSAGTYIVWVAYLYGGERYISNPDGQTETTITIDSGGGGGGGDYNPYFTASGNNTSKTITIDLHDYSSDNIFRFYIYDSNDNLFSGGVILNGTVTEVVSVNDVYKIEVKSEGNNIPALVDNQYQTYAYVTIQSAETWDYTYVGERDVSLSGGFHSFEYNIGPDRNNVNWGVCVKLNFPTDSRYNIKLSNLNGAVAYLIVNDKNQWNYYGWNYNNGVPYTTDTGSTATSFVEVDRAILSGYPYYLWVCGSSNSVAGNVTITITYSTKWTESHKGDVIVQDSVRDITLPLEGKRTYRYNVKFNKSGKATFYSRGSVDLVAYISLSNGGIRDSDGRPNSYEESWDNVSSSDSNYRGTYDVTAGTTYYFYVKSKTGSSYETVYIYFAPQDEQTDRGFWIGTSSGEWRKLKVYIGTSDLVWVDATPYIGINENNPYWIDEY